MPNRYSYSGVLAQYCKSGFISLPEELYLAYIRASSVGSLATQSQLSTTSRYSSTEDDAENPNVLTGANDIGSPSAPDPVRHDQRSRGRNPAKRPQFTLSHKSSSQDQAALIRSFITEIDNEIHPTRTHQPHLRNNVDAGQHFELKRRSGVLIQEPAPADPLSHRNWSPLGERNGTKFAYPRVSDFASSSASVAETTTSDDYALDVPSDLPVHADEAAITPHQTWSTTSRGTTPNTVVAQQDEIVSTRLLEPTSVNSPESRSRPTSNNAAKFPLRSANLQAARQEPFGYANVRNTGTKVKLYPPSSYVSVPLAEGDRSSSRNRNQNQQKTSEDNSLPPISDSVLKTGVEVIDVAALLPDYESGAKILEHGAAAVERRPSTQPTLVVGSIAYRPASSPPSIGSNETRKMQPRRRDLSRPISTISSDTQIYAPLSPASPADSSYINEAAFIPESPAVRPGSLPESTIEQAPSAATQKGRGYSREGSAALYALPNDHSEHLGDSPVEIPSDPDSAGRNDKYTLVYRDRKQEWLQDPAHSVAHFRSPLRRDAAGHRRFASSYTSLTGEPPVAQRLDSLPSATGAPPSLQMDWLAEFDVRSVSEASTSGSSGFYPPDIARHRDESTVARKSESILRSAKQWREDSAMDNVGGSNSLSKKKGTGLLRKLRGVSMGGIL